MATRKVNIDILTSSYRIAGNLEVSNFGVLGVLSDSTCSYLDLRDANMARMHTAAKLTQTTQNIRVIKHQAVAVGLTRREDVGPQAVARGSYSRVFQYPIRITTQVYELEGTFEYAGRFDLSVIMDGTCEFIPLYDASLGAILFPSLFMQSPVILFNRSSMNTLILMNE